MSALKPLLPLTYEELEQLATFGAEQARGLVHRPGYAYEMARLAERWEAHPLEAHGVRQAGLDEKADREADAQAALDEMPSNVRISTSSPHVTGSASSTTEELDNVSQEINGHA